MIMFNGLHLLIVLIAISLTYLLVRPKNEKIKKIEDAKIKKINWITL